MTTFTPLDHDPEEIATCDNCGYQCQSCECMSIQNASERLSAGSPIPAGECPQCGSLSYVRRHDVPHDAAEHIRAIWDVLHYYQDEAIPAYKYREMAADVGAEDPMFPTYEATAESYEKEWDDICYAMARITEELGVDYEDAS